MDKKKDQNKKNENKNLNLPDVASGPTTSQRHGDVSLEKVDYHSAMELTSQGYFNYLSLAGCTLVLFHCMYEMLGIAYVLDPAECDIELTVMEKTLIGSAIFFGIVVTAICWGILGDLFGRRRVMLPAVFGTIIVSFLSSLCTAFWTMFLTRFITGALVSASVATILVYLGELHTDHYRDASIAWAITIVSFAFILVPAIAWLIIPQKWEFNFIKIEIKPWRIYMWTFGMFGLLGGIIMCVLPESPSFVISHAGPKAVLPILAYIYHYNHIRGKKNFPVREIIMRSPHKHAPEAPIQAAIHSLKEIVRAPMRRPYLIVHFCMFMVFFLANGVYLWMPGIFNLVLRDTKLPWTVCTAIKSRYTSDPMDDFVMVPHAGGGGMDCESGTVNTMVYPMAVIMEVVLLLPFIVVTIVIERINKCVLYGFVMAPCAIGLATCVLIPHILAATVALTIGICSGSAASVLSALVVDAFPTSLRALVMCTMFMMGQVGAVLGNTLVGVAAQGPCEPIFFLMSLCIVASIVTIVFLWPNLKEVRKIMEEREYDY